MSGIGREIERVQKAMREAGYKPPAADLGYCTCGTIWNMDAIEDANLPRDQCPDCGLPPAFVEKAK